MSGGDGGGESRSGGGSSTGGKCAHRLMGQTRAVQRRDRISGTANTGHRSIRARAPLQLPCEVLDQLFEVGRIQQQLARDRAQPIDCLTVKGECSWNTVELVALALVGNGARRNVDKVKLGRRIDARPARDGAPDQK